MSKHAKYVQCVMRRPVAGGSVELTSYIPQQFAKMGDVLRLKDEDRSWTSGWVVELVSGHTVEGDNLPDYRKSIRNHRKLTGDSVPRRK